MNLQYLAAIDYAHLDNGIFLNTLAQSISKQKHTQPVIIHADSAYTERVIQTGVMRNEAEIRSQKDLNHRLIALFADEGIAAIGINGYQRKLIKLVDGDLCLNEKAFSQLPGPSALILSTLVWSKKQSSAVPVSLPRLARFIQKELKIQKLFIFNKADTDFAKNELEAESKKWQDLSDEFKEKHLPEEFHQFSKPLYLTDARNFRYLPEVKGSVYIE